MIHKNICHASVPLGELSEAAIAQRLKRYAEIQSRPPYPTEILEIKKRPAAVLIAFTCIEGKWHILFIRRSVIEGDRHGGQVAFPGGAAEPGDADIYATALREAREEVGLQPRDVRILGRLSEFVTITSFNVTPVVAVFDWPYEFTLQPNEVDRAFTIPLEWLADGSNHSRKLRELPPPYQPINVIYFEPYDGEVLWGASAQFTLTLLELLKTA